MRGTLSARTCFIFVVGLGLLQSWSIGVHSVGQTPFEGTYEFLECETEIEKPSRTKSLQKAPEWAGLWLFQNGYYSSVIVKETRSEFFDRRKNDLGFESFAGAFWISGDTVHFKRDYSYHPFFTGHEIAMKYRFANSILVLSYDLFPRLEDTRQGKVKIVLRKLN